VRHFLPVFLHHHVAEHFFITELLAVLTEWHRVLKTDGKLVLELPCWDKVQRLIKADAPDNFTRWALYGQPETHVDGVPALHKWCWSIDEFREVLEAAGFVNIELEQPKFHQPVRDMRWVAIK
jgi:predicted SAM-dependent methyltransferase